MKGELEQQVGNSCIYAGRVSGEIERACRFNSPKYAMTAAPVE